jgi:hypothetical protein
MKPNQRWLILGSLLLATVVAAYLIEDEPAPEKGKRKGSVAAKTASTWLVTEGGGADSREKVAELAAAPLSFPEPAPVEEGVEGKKPIDPFRSKSWFIPPPPPPPPPPPKAPPLPFQYLGKLSEDGETRVFLNHQGKHIIAKVGDVINGTYTVEAIAGGRMTLIYQPLNETQVLAIGSDR